MYRTDPRTLTPEQLETLRRPRIADTCEIIEQDGGKVYKYSKNGTLYVIAYRGKALKPAMHYRYASEERRSASIAEFFAGLRSHNERSAERRTEAAKPHTLTVGDVVYNSWGWEQTNIDFYVVVRASANYVWLQPIAAQTEETGFMCGNTWPLWPTKKLDDKPVTKHRAGIWDGGRVYVNFTHGSGAKWDRERIGCSWYA